MHWCKLNPCTTANLITGANLLVAVLHTLTCMVPEPSGQMGRYRALMTDTDREYIESDEYEQTDERYQAVYRVRKRIEEEVVQDVEILEEHHPELLEELREVVCEDDG